MFSPIHLRMLLPLAAALALLVAARLTMPAQTPAAPRTAAYILGPDDQITIHALHVPEMPEKPVRIEADGYIRLPLVGRVQAGGLTPAQLENELAKRLQEYIEEPEVSVDLADQHSQPVSVLGAVKNPGV